MKTLYLLTPEERLLSTILNTGVKVLSKDHPYLAKTLREVLDTLPDQEQQVLCLRFGLGSAERGHTLAEVGQALRLTRERIRQIEYEALT